MASGGSTSGIGSSSSNARTRATPSSGGDTNEVQLLNAACVIPPDDDVKKPLWRYVEKLENTGKGQGGNKKSMCRLCEREINGSYSRVKAHLLRWSNKGVSQCLKVMVNVLSLLKVEQDNADALVASRVARDIPLRTEGVTLSGSRKRRGTSAIEASFHLETRSQLDAMIARMFYTAGLPFNVARNPWFRKAFMFAANNNLVCYAPPSYNKLRTNLLTLEKNHIERLLQPIKTTWSNKGVSIVSDGWSDPQRRPLLNFLAVTEDGPMFLKAIRTDGEIKSNPHYQ